VEKRDIDDGDAEAAWYAASRCVCVYVCVRAVVLYNELSCVCVN
jgi:hypothetical protein